MFLERAIETEDWIACRQWYGGDALVSGWTFTRAASKQVCFMTNWIPADDMKVGA